MAYDVSPSGLCQEWRTSRDGGVGLPGTAPATESLLPITAIKLCHCLPKHRRMEPVIPPLPPSCISFLLMGCCERQEQNRDCPGFQCPPACCVALSRLLAPPNRRFCSLPDWLNMASCSVLWPSSR